MRLGTDGRAIEPDCIAHYKMELVEENTEFEAKKARARKENMKGYWAGRIAENNYILGNL